MDSDGSATSVRLVRDLMKVSVPTWSPGTSVPELARLMQEKSFEAVVVLNPDNGHALSSKSTKPKKGKE